jgi:hypothetical protein
VTKLTKNRITPHMWSEIQKLIEETDMSLLRIADKFGCSRRHLDDDYKAQYSAEFVASRKKRCIATAQRGNQRRYQNGAYVSVSSGHRYVIKPEWYTGCPSTIYAGEHNIVMCAALGLTELPKGMVVHHRDRDKLNNELDNLQLMTRSAHTVLHNTEGW